MINTLQQQLSDSHKAGIEVLVDLTRTALASTERLASLQLSTLRTLMDRLGEQVRTPGEANQGEALVPLIETMLGYSRGVYDISRDTHTAYTRAYQTRRGENRKSLQDAIEHSVKNAPLGADVALLTLSSVLAASDHAYDTLHQATSQLLSSAEHNVAAVAESAAAPAPKPRARTAA